jgi:hypothetical protein
MFRKVLSSNKRGKDVMLFFFLWWWLLPRYACFAEIAHRYNYIAHAYSAVSPSSLLRGYVAPEIPVLRPKIVSKVGDNRDDVTHAHFPVEVNVAVNVAPFPHGVCVDAENAEVTVSRL